MFQLIVSVIAIALVAILAAASIYYGGSAFTNSNAKGAVAALINAGEQIAGANVLYKVDNTVGVTDINGLVSTYLSAVPTAPKFATGSWKVDAAGTAAYIDLSTGSATQVCAEVGNQGGAAAATMAGSEPAATDLPTNQFGCVGNAFAFKL